MELYFRQRNLYLPSEHNRHATIIGCGSLGSVIACLMAKLGVENFTLYDADRVEEHNLPNQAFYPGQVGQNKSEALKQLIETINPQASVFHIPEFYTQDFRIEEGVVVNAPDCMDARQLVAEQAPLKSFIIDVRSGTDSYNVLMCDKSTQDWDYYKTTFFKNEEAQGTDCNAQSIVYSSHLIAAIALQQYVRWATMKSYHKRVDGCLESLDAMFT